ncbi:hypothetical protein LC048_08275 [Mesobacillus subterraneus]|uniref:hypothetical protein n=1 Tax=Mesobacillus subterraneus TaxID=285983 RepID=UPI001CFC9963|nr:hypothetical protein [Mesobacillus subterraneus]WLR56851.1 hypothetical protein LC048_08275 [Mesobacillus subterraneus]
MDALKSVYQFDNDQQFLKIEFLNTSNHSPWHAFVFDENWNDIISTAAAISDTIADSVEYAYENLGIRGRVAVVENISNGGSLTDMIDVSLFHLQALLFTSAIIVNGDYDELVSFGFSKEKSQTGNSLYILSSDELGNDACRFL